MHIHVRVFFCKSPCSNALLHRLNSTDSGCTCTEHMALLILCTTVVDFGIHTQGDSSRTHTSVWIISSQGLGRGDFHSQSQRDNLFLPADLLSSEVSTWRGRKTLVGQKLAHTHADKYRQGAILVGPV